MPTVTSVSVTASPVVLTAEVAGVSAHEDRGSREIAGSAAIPASSLRRSGDFRPLLISSDMSTPFVFEDVVFAERGWRGLCSAQIRKIAYIAPQNNDVDFGTGVAVQIADDRLEIGSAGWQGGSGLTASDASIINGLQTKRWRITRSASPPRAPGAGLRPALPIPHSAPFLSWPWRRSAARSPLITASPTPRPPFSSSASLSSFAACRLPIMPQNAASISTS